MRAFCGCWSCCLRYCKIVSNGRHKHPKHKNYKSWRCYWCCFLIIGAVHSLQSGICSWCQSQVSRQCVNWCFFRYTVRMTSTRKIWKVPQTAKPCTSLGVSLKAVFIVYYFPIHLKMPKFWVFFLRFEFFPWVLSYFPLSFFSQWPKIKPVLRTHLNWCMA